MSVVVLLNPRAGGAASSSLESSGFEIVELSEGADAAALARAAAGRGATTVVAAGGDGTVSRVADGLIGTAAALGLVPLGTGNDLARTLGIPTDADEAIAIVKQNHTRTIDVIRAQPADGPATYVVNVAAGGLSGQIDEELDSDQKKRWGPFAYLWTAVKVLPEVKPYAVELAFDDEPPTTVLAVNMVVANGRTVGGGWAVAPEASVDDGLADVIVVRYENALDLAAVAARLAAGNYLDSPSIEHRRVRRVRVSCEDGMPFNVDGELVTRAACTFSVVPGALRVLVPRPLE